MTEKEAKALQPGDVFESVLHAEQFRVVAIEPAARGRHMHIVAEKVKADPFRFRPEDLRYYRVKA